MGKRATAAQGVGKAIVDAASGTYGMGAVKGLFKGALAETSKNGLTLKGIGLGALGIVGGTLAAVVAGVGYLTQGGAYLGGARATTTADAAPTPTPTTKAATKAAQAPDAAEASAAAQASATAAVTAADAAKRYKDEYAKFMAEKYKDDDAGNKQRSDALAKTGVMSFKTPGDAKDFVGNLAEKNHTAMTFYNVGADGQRTGGFIFADGKGASVACDCKGEDGKAIGDALHNNTALINGNEALRADILRQIEAFNKLDSPTEEQTKALRKGLDESIAKANPQATATAATAATAAVPSPAPPSEVPASTLAALSSTSTGHEAASSSQLPEGLGAQESVSQEAGLSSDEPDAQHNSAPP